MSLRPDCPNCSHFADKRTIRQRLTGSRWPRGGGAGPKRQKPKMRRSKQRRELRWKPGKSRGA